MAKWRHPIVVGGLALASIFLPVADGGAQITLDGSVGPARSLTGPNYVIGSELGQIRGDNLFQSFGQFNVLAGESATFTGPGSTANIVARVTGGTVSSIDGLIDTRTWMPSASFFLLNPSGVLFGPNAALNVGGAFHVSTADYLRFADQAKFFAHLSRQSTLTVAEPVAFGFLGPTAASISINGSNLTVDPRKTLSVVGGDIRIVGATLATPGGRIQIDGVGSGEVPLQTLDAGSASRSGAMEITRSTLDVSGDPAGTVVIRGGQLTIDTSTVTANTGNMNGAPIGIDLGAAGTLTITNGSALTTATSGAGRGGDIQLTATDLQFNNGAFVSTATSGTGRGGDIQGTATHGVLLDSGTLIASQTGEGDGGNMSIAGDTVTITGGSLVFSQNQSSATGRGGNISVIARDSMGISGTSQIQSEADTAGEGGRVFVSALGSLTMDGSSISSATFGIGRAGDVTVEAGTLTITNGSALTTATSGAGRGGDIQLTATDLQFNNGAFVSTATSGTGRGGDIQGTATHGVLLDSGTLIASQTSGKDGGGNVSITGDTVTITGGSLVFSQNQSSATGRGGNISVIARDSMGISGTSQIQSEADTAGEGGRVFVSALGSLTMDGSSISSVTFGIGRAGDVTVEAGTLSLASAAAISSTTNSAGHGGDVTVTATGSARIAGSSFTGVSTGSFGDGLPGDVLATFGTLTLTGGALIQSGVFAGNQGGNVTVTATSGPIVISDGSGISSQAFFGDVGRVAISAPEAEVVIDNGFVSTSTLQSGRAGDISINTQTLTLTNGGQIASASIESATGGGGNVTVNATGSLTISGRSPSGRSVLPTPFSDFFTDSRSGIFSTAAGTGPGGNITVRSPQIQLLDGGTISAASTGSADALAGNVSIGFRDILMMDHATITTDSLLADGGNIAITSTGSLLQLSNSQITTSVQSGVGAGGNITLGSQLHPLSFVVLGNSAVRADAFGGPGGNIGIFADVYLTSGSLVSASSALSAPGTIDVEARITDLSGSLVQLPENVLQAASLLRASCAARIEGKASSLVVAGREGVPPEPEGLLWSPLGATLADFSVALGEEQETELFPRFAGVWLGSNCAR